MKCHDCLTYATFTAFFFIFNPLLYAEPLNERSLSFQHQGLFDQHGANIIGVTIQQPIKGEFYSFYSYGFPSLIAGGFSYYNNFQDDGLVATVGLGLGTLAYASLAYQWQLQNQDFFTIGIGYAQFFEGNGVYPVISYAY